MNNPETQELVYSKAVAEFITVANDFCIFVEKADHYTKEDIISYFLKVNPLLYIKAALLPEIERNDFEISERYVTEEQYVLIFSAIKEKIGEDDFFYYNPETGEKTEVIKQASLII